MFMLHHRNQRCTKARRQPGGGSASGARERLGGDEAAETQLLQEPCHGDSSECDCHDRYRVVWSVAGFENKIHCLGREDLESMWCAGKLDSQGSFMLNVRGHCLGFRVEMAYPTLWTL